MGSTPILGTIFLILLDDYKTAYYADNKELMCSNYGGVAQLARAFGSYPKGRGFDPLSRYHKEICSSFKLEFFVRKFHIIGLNIGKINLIS